MSNSLQRPYLYSGFIPNRNLQSCHTDQNFPFHPKSQKFLSQSQSQYNVFLLSPTTRGGTRIFSKRGLYYESKIFTIWNPGSQCFKTTISWIPLHNNAKFRVRSINAILNPPSTLKCYLKSQISGSKKGKSWIPKIPLGTLSTIATY